MATVGGGWDHEAPWGMPAGTADGESLWETRTFRRFIYAVLLLVALVALFMLLGAVE